MIRVRLPKAPTPQTTVVLDPDQSHHLVAVLRVREGDPIIALAADGSRWSCEVASAGPPVTLAIAERYQGPDADPEGHLTVAISTLKGGRTADTVRALASLADLHAWNKGCFRVRQQGARTLPCTGSTRLC